MQIEKRYGTILRIFDNGGRSADRYTVIAPRWAKDYYDSSQRLWFCIGCNSEPFHPQGIGMCSYAIPGSHLGKRIHWDTLPPDVQKFARQTFPEYAPKG